MALSEQYQLRFGGIARLYGNRALEQLHQAHFVVVGLGGVGAWVCEALARSGVMQLSLIEMDEVCITNSNRQLHALASTIGQSKAAALAARLRDINPEIQINIIEDFLDKTNIATYIQPEHDYIVDAIDAANVKASLIAYCKARKIPILTIGSAGGKSDARKVTSDDLARTISDPMLAKVRHQLFKFYNFSKDRNRKFAVEAVYSTEQAVYPKPDGDVCQQKSALQEGVKLDCTSGFGSSSMLAGTMGFVAAERAIQRYLAKRQ